MARTEQLLFPALRGPRSFNDFLEIALKRRKSDAGIEIEFLGLTATSPNAGGLAMAEASLELEGARKLGKVPHQIRESGTASVAQMHKLES